LKRTGQKGNERGYPLSERHPEKQGLKLEHGRVAGNHSPLSERHPEKQGLKLQYWAEVSESLHDSFRAPSRKTRIETTLSCLKWTLLHSFRAPSRKTRIETIGSGWMCMHAHRLSERHPEKQGLKLLQAVT